MNNLVSRSLSRVRAIVSWGGEEKASLSSQDIDRLKQQMQDCVDGVGGEVSARQRAIKLAENYLSLDKNGRHAFLRLIALEFGPDPDAVAKAHDEYRKSLGTLDQWQAEATLREAIRSRRIRILTQFNAIPQGVKFLVDMRADLLGFLKEDPELKALDREFETRLGAWFDVGFLELKRITWDSPAALLEKLVEYEAVHEIRSWTDLKNRLDTDRRCYAFFHPRMPTEPLIFVEVALTTSLAGNVQKLLDVDAPVADNRKANTAIFYSISNTQAGLRGVSFGNFLLKRVIDDLKQDLPGLKQFATLSPLPRFRAWVRENPAELASVFTDADWKKLAPLGMTGPGSDLFRGLLADDLDWTDNEKLMALLKAPFTRLAARYLLTAQRGQGPFDPVARFHLGNGARLEHIHWLADTSDKGFDQSFGMMVNYLYDPDDIETNIEAFAQEGKVASASTIRRLIKR